MAKKAANRDGKSLVIVESPAKARTISKFLGTGFTVEASIGHVRDLPQGAKQIPAEFKGEDWAYLGVNVNHDFDPVYIIPPGKTAQVRKLKALLKDAKDLYLATDEDREGEAISWHLHELLKPKVPVHRLVFHEITKEAIQEALEHPRDIDDDLVKAQETAADHRPAVRVRSLAAAVAQGAAKTLGRSRAKRGRAVDRRTRTPAHGVQLGDLLGLAGHVRQDRRPTLRRRAGQRRRPQDSRRQGF